MPIDDVRAALGNAPDDHFTAAVAAMLRGELDAGSKWTVRVTRHPSAPVYIAWPDVLVERASRVQAAIVCRPRYEGPNSLRSELIDIGSSTLLLSLVTRESLAVNLALLVYGAPRLAITYHTDLRGLIKTTMDVESPESLNLLRELIRSRRLRDIAKLSHDLAA